MKQKLDEFCFGIILVTVFGCTKNDSTDANNNTNSKAIVSVQPAKITNSAAEKLQALPEGETNKINISLPEGYLPMNRNLHSRTAIMLEYGDGYFTTDSSSLHTFVGNPSEHSYLLHKTGIYDHGGRPPRHTASRYSSQIMYFVNSPLQSNTPQRHLSPGKKITIIPNVNSVVAEDVMTFACAYNASGINNPNVEFYYNHSNSYNFNIFDVLKSTSTIPCEGGVSVPSVRTNNSGVALNFEDAMGKYGFRNVAKISLANHDTENIERNVFLSLRPSETLNPYWFSSTKVIAVLKNGNTVIDTAVLQMPIPTDGVHDPNLLTIIPPFFTGNLFGNNAYKYIIDFENEAHGLVYKIKARINLPIDADENLIRSSISCNLGGKIFRDLQINFTRQSKQLFAEITIESFTPHNILLWRKADDTGAELQNKGYFTFYVKSNSGIRITPLESKADITFNNETPVFTNAAIPIKHFLPLLGIQGRQHSQAY